MLLARFLIGLRRRRSRACSFGLLLVLVALVPLAYASPPDPMWIAGIYDDADFDEVVVAVVSACGLLVIPVTLTMPADIAAEGVQSHDTVLGAATLASPFTIRAPPSVTVIAGK